MRNKAMEQYKEEVHGMARANYYRQTEAWRQYNEMTKLARTNKRLIGVLFFLCLCQAALLTWVCCLN